MNVTCPDCSSVFRVDPAKVPESGIRARCGVCGGVIPVSRVRAATQQRASGPVLAQDSAYAPEATPSTVAPSAALSNSPAASSVAFSTAAAREPADAAVLGAEPTQAAPAPAPASRPTPEVAPPDRPARPFNPYLSNTPELRARRLARALVSDLVAYNPQKREEGLRDGTLRQLFRDEIRKSWEEYVEQVGAHVAESTPHFQDALNDVLAGGRRVF